MLFLVVLIIFVLIILMYIVYGRKPKHISNLIKETPCENLCLPVLGHAYLCVGSKEDFMKNFKNIAEQTYKNKHGIISFWLINKLFVFTSDAICANLVLKTGANKGNLVTLLAEYFGKGLIFTSSAEDWRRRRKPLMPMYAPKYIDQFFEVMNRNSLVMVRKLASVSGRGDFSIWDFFAPYGLDSACEATFGINVNSQDDPDHEFFKALKEYRACVAARLYQPWLQNDTIYKMLHKGTEPSRQREILYNFIKKLMDERKFKGNPNLRTFSEHCKKVAENITSYDIVEETLSLVMSSTETTNVASCFAVLLLSQHADVQDRVFQEIKEVLEDREITIDDLSKLKYLDAVVKESMRLYMPGPLLVRKLEKDIILPTGLLLHKGLDVIINTWGIHRNPQYWGENAEKFKPERFLNLEPENLTTYLPFASGIRSCPAIRYVMFEIKLAIINLLRHYRLKPAISFKYDDDNTLRVSYDVLLRHLDNFQVRLENRT